MSTKQIAKALAGEAQPLTAAEWADLYGKLWELYDSMVAENKKMRAQLAVLHAIEIRRVDQQIADQLPQTRTLH